MWKDIAIALLDGLKREGFAKKMLTFGDPAAVFAWGNYQLYAREVLAMSKFYLCSSLGEKELPSFEL